MQGGAQAAAIKEVERGRRRIDLASVDRLQRSGPYLLEFTIIEYCRSERSRVSTLSYD